MAVKVGDMVLWGKNRRRAKVTGLYKGAISRIEMPPGSGTEYAPLIENGRNVEEYVISGQINMFDD